MATIRHKPKAGALLTGTEYEAADAHENITIAGEDITSGTVADARIASTIARDSEVTAAISALSTVYQPLDSDLTAVAALTTTAYGRALLELANQAALLSAAGAAAASHAHAGEDVTSGTVADARIASTIARDSEVTAAINALSSVYQPLDSDLTSIASLTTTAFGRGLLELANAGALLSAAGAAAAGHDHSGTYEPSGAVATHTGDTTDAHDASAVSFDPTGLAIVAGTEVQTAIEELDAAVDGLGAGGGAPADATYLVTTANGTLSAEVVVGATPGGELGGTWASPTVDATHSGSTHSAAADAHIADATAAHAASAVSVDSTNLSGTATDVQASLEELDNLLDDHSVRHEDGGADEISIAGLSGMPAALQTHLDDTTAAHAASAIAFTPAGTIAATDGQAAIEEVATDAASALSTHAAAGDPHAGYVLESAIGSTVQAFDADIPTVAASQAEMEAGTEAALRSMSPLRVAQAIAALGGGGGSTFPLDSYLASSGSARNDEFDDGPGIDGKWTLAGNALDDTDENNDYPERLLLRRNDTGSKISIYYQDLPSFPCDITAHMAASTFANDYARGGGLCLLPATPSDASPCLYTGFLANGGRRYESAIYTNLSTFGSTPTGSAIIGGVPSGLWLRLTVLSGGTTADLYWSVDGHFWTLAVAAQALGFTVANAGIGLAPEGQAADLLALFDYYRVSA